MTLADDLEENLKTVKRDMRVNNTDFDTALDDPGDRDVLYAVAFLRGAASALDCTVREMLDEHGFDPDDLEAGT